MSAETVQAIRQRIREDAAFRARFFASASEAIAGEDLTPDEREWFLLPNFSWVLDGVLAGVSRPRSADALRLLHERGVRAVVSLTEDPLDDPLLASFGFEALHLPVPDMTPPTPETLERAVTAIDAWRSAGVPVAVHCMAGIGRTGTVLACYLVKHGASADDAIRELRRTRPGSVETEEQAVAVRAYADAIGRGTEGDS